MQHEIRKPLSEPRSYASRAREVAAAYISLTKPRIISLLLVVTLAVMIIAGERLPPAGLPLLTLAGGAGMSGAANVLNCYLDRDIDRVMSRTRNRPLVTQVLSPGQALAFGLGLALLSFGVLAFGVNVLSGLLALGGLLMYVLVYTPAKRITPYSVILGAVAGAAPPLVAWAAVTGSLNAAAWLLFGIMTAWQIPHTLALSVMLYNDYARANVPVSPVAKGLKSTQREIVAYSIILWAITMVPVAMGFFGPTYGVGVFVLGGQFCMLAMRGVLPAGLSKAGFRSDTRLYKYSLLYLALLFTLMTVDRLLQARLLG